MQRRATNKIIKVQNSHDEWLDKEADIICAFSEFFKSCLLEVLQMDSLGF